VKRKHGASRLPVVLPLYRSEKWGSFREQILDLDGYSCRRCGKRQAGGAILQVHHTVYLAGHLPWDYPPSSCETLCKGCHAAQHGKIRPQTGWELLGWDDSDDLCEHCENCGTEIRYVFHIWHLNWEPLAVGEICCDHLTCSELASNFLESQKRYESRLARFLDSPRWRVEFGIASIRQNKIRVDIHEVSPSGFRIYMNWRAGKRVFETLVDAKRAAFSVISDGSVRRYFEKHPTE
jgi:hypothetical protein